MQIYLLVKKQNKKANAPTLMRIKINYEKKNIYSVYKPALSFNNFEISLRTVWSHIISYLISFKCK